MKTGSRITLLVIADATFVPILVLTIRAAQTNDASKFPSLVCALLLITATVFWLIFTTDGFRALRLANAIVFGAILTYIAYGIVAFNIGND